MAMYRYVKAIPRRPLALPAVISYVFITAGFAILAWTIWPIVSFTVFLEPFLTKTVSPIGEVRVSSKSGVNLPSVVLAGTGESDYINPNLWFPTSPQKKVVAPVNSYKLSIPKLKIQDALVVIAGDDLSTSLIHYGGTGLPGEYGTAVVFGHSTLPQFFNPKNYTTIFSTLPTLKVGDEILVAYDGITYRYIIFEITVTEPNDLSPLEQRFDDSYLTLITCVPPGTYIKRLNVKARLAPPPQ